VVKSLLCNWSRSFAVNFLSILARGFYKFSFHKMLSHRFEISMREHQDFCGRLFLIFANVTIFKNSSSLTRVWDCIGLTHFEVDDSFRKVLRHGITRPKSKRI
jgi:hypothetical protein